MPEDFVFDDLMDEGFLDNARIEEPDEDFDTEDWEASETFLDDTESSTIADELDELEKDFEFFDEFEDEFEDDLIV